MTKATFILLLASSLFAEVATPLDTMKAFYAAFAAKDAGTASALWLVVGPYTNETNRTKVQEWISRDLKIPELKGAKALKKAAVVVMYESPTDPDPAFLINQNGKWMILPKLTSFKIKNHTWPDDVQAEFEELESWFKEQVGKK